MRPIGNLLAFISSDTVEWIEAISALDFTKDDVPIFLNNLLSKWKMDKMEIFSYLIVLLFTE